ncbi:hypothetical protein CYY_002292 [Polysphondylium violaceum]|uniref:Presequence protease, mitochondrial n=1 Tax=Polysphondylium violaceum TaxID=133409 RepID=A0A8J4Q0E6_9MYCE|nr:hypothetical protein CYY_002292 [Polysphondylium violaceum]
MIRLSNTLYKGSMCSNRIGRQAIGLSKTLRINYSTATTTINNNNNNNNKSKLLSEDFNINSRINNKNYCIASAVAAQPSTKPISRGRERQQIDLKIGDTLHGFKVVDIQDVKEKQLKTFRLKHIETGAEYLHIDTEDTNNVFSVTFKTTPQDSTGVAHILEHTTLCGSEKYPVRDPFFNMLKRSLNTYMNAWTAPDHTSYPFGSQDPKDFYNLMSVYLDATFFPLLSEQDFRQEGHRLEFDQMENPASQLKFKGIVFNEMKGALSDPNSYYAEQSQQHLYPSTTYSYNSGGEPLDIPNLSYQELKDFHSQHYHPSNAYFFTYGDLDIKNHLKFIQENCLNRFTRNESIVEKTKIGKVPRWSETKRIQLTCPPSSMDVNPERKHKFSISILHKDTKDVFESLVMHMLSQLLLRGSNTPMYQALLESGLALDYTPNTGYDDNLAESSFSVGGVGIRAEDLEKVEKTIIQTLEKAAENGFAQNVIESILHQYEFAQKNVSASFGLNLAGGLSSYWIHGGDPVSPLYLNKNVERLRKEIADGKPFFQNKIKELLANPHKLVITMQPDEHHQKKDADAELARLESIRAQLKDQDVQEIIAHSKELQARQNQEQDVSCLPKINICDIEKKQKKIHHRDTVLETTPLRVLDQPTNGISYFRATIDISTLPEDLKPYVPIFCSFIDEMGAGQFDHKQLDTEINLYTGKFSTSPLISGSPFDLAESKEQILLKSACLNHNTDKMFDLWTKILLENRWKNADLLKILLAQRQSSMVENIPSSGLSYAKTYSGSKFSRGGYLGEMWSGLAQVRLTNQMVSQNDMDGIIDKLARINQFVIDRSLMKCLVTTENTNITALESSLASFLKPFPILNNGSTINHFANTSDTNANKSFFAIPATVNYVSQNYQSVPYTHQDSSNLQVLSKVLSEYLHKEIREKGGAYGGGVSLDSGLISFYSYRDPNLLKTLNAFNESIQWSLNDKITDKNIESAQLSIFSDFDSPESPSNRGVAEWMRGITNEMKQERRDRLLNIKKKDLEQVSQKYLNNNNPSYTTVLGPANTDIQSDTTNWKSEAL